MKQVLDLIYCPANQNVILVVSNVLLVLANISLAYLSYRSIKALKLHSSQKPFLEPSLLGLDPGFGPKLKIINYGPGHAVKVKVRVTAMADLCSSKISKYELTGPSFIPSIDKYNYGIYKYHGDKDIAIVDDMKVIITYESDSGYKRKTVWKRVKGNISNEMMRNEEFIIEESK